jgi:hypothetical protein
VPPASPLSQAVPSSPAPRGLASPLRRRPESPLRRGGAEYRSESPERPPRLGPRGSSGTLDGSGRDGGGVPRSSAERANPFENAAAAAAAGERRYIRTGLDDAAAALATTSRLRASVSRIKASAMAPGRGGADGGAASLFLPLKLASSFRRQSTEGLDGGSGRSGWLSPERGRPVSSSFRMSFSLSPSRLFRPSSPAKGRRSLMSAFNAGPEADDDDEAGPDGGLSNLQDLDARAAGAGAASSGAGGAPTVSASLVFEPAAAGADADVVAPQTMAASASGDGQRRPVRAQLVRRVSLSPSQDSERLDSARSVRGEGGGEEADAAPVSQRSSGRARARAVWAAHTHSSPPLHLAAASAVGGEVSRLAGPAEARAARATGSPDDGAAAARARFRARPDGSAAQPVRARMVRGTGGVVAARRPPASGDGGVDGMGSGGGGSGGGGLGPREPTPQTAYRPGRTPVE